VAFVQLDSIVPVDGFHESIDVAARLCAIVHVIGMLVHIERNNRPAAGNRIGMIGRPLIDQSFVMRRIHQQHPTGAATFRLALDAATRDDIMAELFSEMHELGLPALAVSHDPHLAALADRMAVMNGRRIVQQGSPAEVLSRPASAAVARLLGYRNLFTARVLGHETNAGVTLLEWKAANSATLRVPQQPELAAGQLVQWMIAPAAVRLPSWKPEPHRIDNPVTGRVELRLNLGAHFQVALRCGTERLWLSAPRKLERHHGLEIGCEVTVDLHSDGLVCWPHPA
jgi:molybdate/tungstate transport system ATP-binding protein